jgi:Ran GTPase-activating protein (RanGAP) involved in mRNA processing and transport
MKLSPAHMALEKIDLSGFRLKRFSRSGFRELLEGLSMLPCIRTVILRDNGINDECESEIMELLSMNTIRFIDLSKNNIGPKLANAIGKKLKDEVTHIQWIDLTQNAFYQDSTALSMII